MVRTVSVTTLHLFAVGLICLSVRADIQPNRVQQGPPYVIAPIRTGLQRLLIPAERDLIVLMNPDSLTDAAGTLNPGVWNDVAADLKGPVQEFQAEHQRAPVVDFYIPFRHREVNLFALTNQITLYMQRTAGQAGSVPPLAIWFNQHTERLCTASKDELADLTGEVEVDDPELVTPNVRVYVVQTMLSRICSGDADCVVRFTRPLSETGGGLDAADLEDLVEIITTAPLLQRNRMILRVHDERPPGAPQPDRNLEQLGIDATLQGRLGFKGVFAQFE
jgi:hypothetical protein